MKILIGISLLLSTILAEDVRLDDLEPNVAQQYIESKDQSLKYAPKVDSNVPAVRVLGNQPTNVLEDIYLANQYHGQDGLGGYLYGYSVPDIAKTEKKKAGGDLKGAYNYINGDGQEIKVEYWDDGTGFHQIDNVPKILPQQIDDLPEVKAAKEEHLRLWAEQAERNSHPVESPYENNHYKPEIAAQIGTQKTPGLPQFHQNQGQYQHSAGQQHTGQYQPNPGQYQQNPGQYQQNQGQYQQNPGQYQQNPGQHQQNVGQHQQNQGQYQQSQGQHPQNQGQQYPGQYQQNPGQYQQKPGSYQQNQGQHQQGFGQQGQHHQTQGLSQPGQYQNPGSYQQTQGQHQQGFGQQGQHHQTQGFNQPGQYQKPGAQQNFGQPQHQGQSGFQLGQQSGLQSGQQNAFSQGQHQQGQHQQGQHQQGQYQPGQGQYHQGQHQQGQHQQGQHQYQQSASSFQTSYQKPDSNSGNVNTIDYSGQYTEPQTAYQKPLSQKQNEEEDEEEKGPPRGFFYNFDYPVGIIVNKDGGNPQHKRESISEIYTKNKDILEKQLKEGSQLSGSAYPNYFVTA